MRLAELAARTGSPLRKGIADPDIRGLSADSRSLRPGYLFAALQGGRTDGTEFLEDAARRGAAAALVPPAAITQAQVLGLAAIPDEQPRRRLARMAAAFYGSQPRIIVAVTGTNGKTSTAHFLAGLWRTCGIRAATIGTLGVRIGVGSDQAEGRLQLTTPEPVALHAELAALHDSGIAHAVLEASSHGLDQHRLDGVRIAIGILTTIGRDHLDYHGTEEAYRAAKRRLFSDLVIPRGTAIFNTESIDPATRAAAADRALDIVTYGRGPDADWRLLAAEPHGQGQRLHVGTPDGEWTASFTPLGAFQAENALAAAAAAAASGIPAEEAIAGLSPLSPPAGRLERVAAVGRAAVYVDYAHTPDALAAALVALRPHVVGLLHVVFGCGGDRDPGKRRLMGAVAGRYADRVTVTDDNPRSENPAAIRAAVLKGVRQATEIGDRRDAIADAIGSLAPGDALLIAGKGHESIQIVKGVATPFDDRVVAQCLAGRLGA